MTAPNNKRHVSEIVAEYPIILTGVPRDRSWLIIILGESRKIGESQLMLLLDVIVSRHFRRPGYVPLDPKSEAHPLRRIVGEVALDTQGRYYRLAFEPRLVGVDPTFFGLPDEVVSQTTKAQIRECCTPFDDGIAEHFLGGPGMGPEPALNGGANERRKPAKVRG